METGFVFLCSECVHEADGVNTAAVTLAKQRTSIKILVMLLPDSTSHILVVDDSATMRRMVIASLRVVPDTNFQEAANGLEAIERLAISTVNLIVLDLNMPDMHGLEVVAFVRKHTTFRDIPIIVLTTRGDDESRTLAIAAGASLYLTKPFDPAVLAEGAGRLLGLDVY